MKLNIDLHESETLGMSIGDFNINVKDENDNNIGEISPKMGGRVTFTYMDKHYNIDLKEIFTQIISLNENLKK